MAAYNALTLGTSIERNATVLVAIRVARNVQRPMFDQSKYRFEIHPGATPPYLVGLVSATDMDKDRLTFSLVNGTRDAQRHFFVDSYNGSITLKEALPSFDNSTYEMFVKVSDNRLQAKEDFAKVTVVAVRDVNQPMFTAATLSQREISIPVDELLNRTLFTVEAKRIGQKVTKLIRSCGIR